MALITRVTPSWSFTIVIIPNSKVIFKIEVFLTTLNGVLLAYVAYHEDAMGHKTVLFPWWYF